MQDPVFWHDKWEAGRIGFHQENYHGGLLKYWSGLNLQKDATVFVPLCGKTSDMLWLAAQGHKIIGAELSPIAARDFFAENKLDYHTSKTDTFEICQGANLRLLVGDFFDVAASQLTHVQAVYDRAALIALPPEMRERYAAHLKTILRGGDQILLITLSYDQTKMDGPPFSVSGTEIERLYGHWCDITQLETCPQEDFRGIKSTETIYHLTVK